MRRGRRLRAFAARLFDARTMARVIDPAIADLQAEHASLARYAAVWKVIALCVPEVSMKIGPALLVSGGALASVVAALEARPLFFAWSQRVFDPWMLVYLLPQGLAIAVNVALVAGILAVYGGHAISTRASAWVLGLSLVVSAASFINAGWVTPPANQAFRERVFRQTPTSVPFARGFPELTFGEVRQQYNIATRNMPAVDVTDLHYLAVNYHGRWALTFSPMVFAMFGLALVGLRPVVRWTTAAGVCAAYMAYLFYLDVPNLPALDGRWLGGAAWYPEVAIAAIAFVLMFTHRRQADAVAG